MKGKARESEVGRGREREREGETAGGSEGRESGSSDKLDAAVSPCSALCARRVSSKEQPLEKRSWP